MQSNKKKSTDKSSLYTKVLSASVVHNIVKSRTLCPREVKLGIIPTYRLAISKTYSKPSTIWQRCTLYKYMQLALFSAGSIVRRHRTWNHFKSQGILNNLKLVGKIKVALLGLRAYKTVS